MLAFLPLFPVVIEQQLDKYQIPELKYLAIVNPPKPKGSKFNNRIWVICVSHGYIWIKGNLYIDERQTS